MDTWTLIDIDGLKIGVVQRFRYESWRVSGRLMPDLGYSRYRRLFADLEYAANEQLFTHVDDLERSIAALRIRAVGPRGEDDPQRVANLQIMGDWCQFQISSTTRPAGEQPLALTPAERESIRTLIAFVREGCPDGACPPGFPADRIDEFRRAALEYFSDPPDPINHFRIDVPSDGYIRAEALVYEHPSGIHVELDLFADGERCDLTATFDLDRESAVFSGPRLYDMHVM